jgi:hypothetical protein
MCRHLLVFLVLGSALAACGDDAADGSGGGDDPLFVDAGSDASAADAEDGAQAEDTVDDLSADLGDDTQIDVVDDTGQPDTEPECEPFAIGCVDADTSFVCQGDGVGYDVFDCREGLFCVAGACATTACVPDSVECVGDAVVACGSDGEVATSTPCAAEPACAANDAGCACIDATCVERTCVPGTARCVGAGTQPCEGDGLAWGELTDCDTPYCVDGECRETLCEIGTSTCDGDTRLDCVSSDALPTETDCTEDGAFCDEGECVPWACDPGSVTCSDTRTSIVACDARGTTETVAPCVDGTYCDDGGCVDQVCVPSTRSCDGAEIVECSALGDATTVVSTCTTGCRNGACIDPCEAAGATAGCDFWAAGVPNFLDTASSQLVVALASDTPATVQYLSNGFVLGTVFVTTSTRMRSRSVAPAVAATGYGTAVRVQSTAPVTVTALNSVELSQVGGTVDSAMVLPTRSSGREFVVFGAVPQSGRPVYLTMIGTVDGTRVTVRTSTAVTAGGSVAEQAAGTSATYDLDEGEVLQLSSLAGSFSGTTVSATRPIGVFSASNCTTIPGGASYCDALLEQVPPVDQAATRFAVPRSQMRGTADPDYVTVVAVEDGTTVETTPVVAGLDGVELDAGESVTAAALTDVIVDTSRPVLVTSSLIGGWAGGAGIPDTEACDSINRLGDPSVWVVPRPSSTGGTWVFPVVSGFAESFLSVAVATGTSVTVSGVVYDTPAATFGGFDFYRIPTASALVHTLTTDGPTAAIAYGYGCGYSVGTAISAD